MTAPCAPATDQGAALIETVAAVDNTEGAEAIEGLLLIKVDIRRRKKAPISIVECEFRTNRGYENWPAV